jgi:hypothetical protein
MMPSWSARSEWRRVIAVLLVDAGLTLLLIGAVSLVRPLRPLGIRSRRTAGLWLSAGVGALVAGALLPAPLRRVSDRRWLLDDFVPEYHFSEHHEVRIHAPPDRVFAAVRTVTAREIRFFRLLTWIRAPRLRSARESILAPSPDRPILDVALGSGFCRLAEEPGREIVIGTLLGAGRASGCEPSGFAAFDRPGISKAVMNFRIEEDGPSECRLITETRVFSTDDSARRRFAIYWRVIYPGSSLIRRMWLDAVRRRAERPPDPAVPPLSAIS